MSADDEDLRARLRALEAEVAATGAAARARKADAMARIQARRAAAAGESAALRRRQAELITGKPAPDDDPPERPAAERPSRSRGNDLDRALALARKAGDVKDELARPTRTGEKSWLVSGALSFFFGPLGWLYAGSFRETIPAAALYLIVAGLVSKIIPMFLLMPVLMVVLALSGVAGLVYAIGYNRAGERIRLFGDDKPAAGRLGALGKRDLPPGDDDA